MRKEIFVSKDENAAADFTSVAEAVKSIPKENRTPVIIRIAPGVYHEKLTVDRDFVTLKGMGKNSKDTVLTFDDYANGLMEDGSKRGTFRSYSVFVDAHDVTMENLTIENASGDSLTHGQGIALYADGDRLVINACNIIGHQDTLFTGPLPPKEIIKDGFIGPKQFAKRLHTRQYYKDCYICGDIDFIFGSATAYFEDCTLESLRHIPGEAPVQGYVTAASTPEEEEYGYIFKNCHLISGECPEGTVYLGRPWRDYARTVFINCSMGGHIKPELFHDWNKENAQKNVFYGIYDEKLRKAPAEAFPRRAAFVRELDEGELYCFSKEKALSGGDGWLA